MFILKSPFYPPRFKIIFDLLALKPIFNRDFYLYALINFEKFHPDFKTLNASFILRDRNWKKDDVGFDTDVTIFRKHKCKKHKKIGLV